MPRRSKRVSPAVSVANKGFVPAPVSRPDVDDLNGADDMEGVRLEKGRKAELRMHPERPIIEAEAVKRIGGKKIMYILEESPNDFKITVNAPADHDSAVSYYSAQLRMYKLRKTPEEYALIQYQLALLFSECNRKPNLHISNVRKDLDDRAKMIENTLFHLNKAKIVFTMENYPMMFAVICTLTGQMLRERTTLMNNRCFVNTGRGTISECIMRGLEQLLEAFEVFVNAKQQSTEHAICALEAGWLYLLQSDQPGYKHDPIVREQSIIYLERALALVQETKNPFRDEKPRLWDPQDPSTHPRHIRVLLVNRPVSFVEGMSIYLLGRVYMDWGLEFQYQEEAFNKFNLAVKPKFLTPDIEYWGEAHHKTALIILQCPLVVDPDYVKPKDLTGPGAIYPSELYLDSAISHLTLSLRCSALSGSQLMDVYFHRAQAYLVKFYNITDKVPPGASILNALLDVETHGIEIMEAVEDNLISAIELVTPANTQSPQDGLIFYFSCLKLADFRILEAGIRHKKDAEERDALIRDAVAHIVNALLSRSLEENMDLHHLAICQLAQLVFSARRGHAASKCYAKAIMSYSCVINRFNYHDAYVKSKVQEDLGRLVSQAMMSCNKHVTWEKKHLGSILCNASVTPGYASWSFEKEAIFEDDVPVLRSAEERAPPKEGPRGSRQVVPKQDFKAIDKLAAVQALDDGGSIATDDFEAQGRVTVSSQAIIAGKTTKGAVTALNLHAIKKREPTDPVPAPLREGVNNDSFVASSPVRRPRGVPPLSAYGHKPELTADGKPMPNLFASRKRRRVPWPGEFEYEREKEMLMAQSRPILQLASLLPSHSNIRVGKDKEKSYDKGFSKRREQVRREEDDREDDDEDQEEEAEQEDGESDQGELSGKGKSAKSSDPKSAWKTSAKASPNRSKRVQVLGNASSKYSAKKVRIEEPSSSWDKKPGDDDSDPEDVDLGYFGAWIARARTMYFNSKAAIFNTANNAVASIKNAKHKMKKAYEEFLGPPKVIVRGGDMWASKSAWYALMVMSRMARLQLVLRSTVLNAIKGERTRVVLKECLPEHQQMYNKTRKVLFAECKKLIVMPQTLRELMQRPYVDLRAIFESQTTMYKYCGDVEDIMDAKLIGQQDCFVPMIHLAPSIRRNLEAFDRSIYDIDSFSECMKYEAEVAQRLQEEKVKKVHDIEDKERKWGETHYTQPAAASVSKKMVASSQKGVSSGDSIVSSTNFAGDKSLGSSGHVAVGSEDNLNDGEGSPLRSFPKHEHEAPPVPLPPKRPSREEEAKEDAKLGKMTYSFSHILDGSWEGDIRKNFSRHISANEVLLQWHVPQAHNQNIMVVMAWRQAVMKLGRADASKTSTGGASNVDEVDEDIDEKRRLAAKNRNVFKPIRKSDEKLTSKQKRNSPASPEEEEEEKTAEEIENELGIVIEIARCDLEVNQLQSYLNAYLDAVHSKPQPMRQSQMTDALRVLSAQLAIGELLQMAPATTVSIVICCPPILRLIPWHLLLIDAVAGTVPCELQESYVKPPKETEQITEKPKHRHNQHHNRHTNGSAEHSSPNAAGSDSAAVAVVNQGSAAKVTGFGEPELVSIHLIEKYLVRLGPTLSIWEICCHTAKQFSHSVGLHRMVAVNGESGEKAELGIRNAAMEISVSTTTFSGDPEDYKVFNGQQAIASRLRTMFAGSAHLTRPVVVSERKTDEEAMMELGRLKAEKVLRKEQKAKDKEKKKAKKAEAIRQQAESGRYVLDHSSSEDSDQSNGSNSSSSSEGEEVEEEKLLQTIRLSTCRVLHLAAAKAVVKAQLNSTTRTANMSSPSKPMSSSSSANTAAITLPMSAKADAIFEAQRAARERERLILLGEDSLGTDSAASSSAKQLGTRSTYKISKRQAEHLRDSLSAKDVISQLFLRNCGLCVLSRFGITDDVAGVDAKVMDSNLEFLEAMHMAGATSVLYPIWSGNAQGALGTLASLLFFVRFYTELPTFSSRKYSIVHAMRKAQIWLKCVTGDEVIQFLKTVPLPKKARQELIEEMTSYIVTINKSPIKASQPNAKPTSDASISSFASSLQRASEGDSALDRQLKALNEHNKLTGVSTEDEATMYSALPRKSRPVTAAEALEQQSKAEDKRFENTPGGDRQFFSHYLYWGMFTVSGHGGNVHHPELAGDDERVKADLQKGTREFQDDPELKNMAFEVRFLRMEGRVDEAYELEQVMRRMQINRMKKRLQKIRDAGLLAGRKILDGLDRLDKMLLDQDSDEVSVSDEDEHKSSAATTPAKLGPGKSALTPSTNTTPVGQQHQLKALRSVQPDVEAQDGQGGGDDDDDDYRMVETQDGMRGRGDIDEQAIIRSELIKSKKFPKSSEVTIIPSKKGEKSRSRRVMKSGKDSSSKGSKKGLEMKKDDGEGDEEDNGRPIDLSALGVTRAALQNAREFRATLGDAKRTLEKDVRSYADATQTAQQMLAKLPPPSEAAKKCIVS